MALASGSFNLKASGINTKTNEFGNVVSDPISLIDDTSISSGTGADAANLIYFETHNATKSIDLVGGSMADTFGATQSYAAVKGIVIVNNGSSDITLEGNFITSFLLNGDGAATAGILIKAGSKWAQENFSAAGWIPVGGASDTITITNAGASEYKIVLFGLTA
jgi:hypothetical protein